MTALISPLTRLHLALLATIGSLSILLGAFVFQAMGYAPCAMCLWQRWPHAIVIVIGALFLATRLRLLLILGALVMVVSSGLGLFHAGVEQGWWPGPSSCTSSGPSLSGLSGMDLLPSAGAAKLVLCDEIVWDTWGLGITMAGWNFLFSLVFMALWIMAWTKPR